MEKLYHINSAYSLVNTLYDLEPGSEDFEDLALSAWNLINNKHTRLYRYVADTENRELLLPCNVQDIESVHIPLADAQMTSNKDMYSDLDSLFVEHYIDVWKFMEDPLTQRGKFVKYRDGGDRLYFNRDYHRVMVVYHGIIVSEEDGLPMINDREMRAIAAYIAYALYFKEALRTKNKDTMALVQTLKEDWLRKCNAARIVDYLSQNDMDKILDVKSRWDRKQYGKSYKIAL